MIKSDRLFGVVCLALAVTMGIVAWGLVAPISYEPIGPRNYPLLLAGMMTLCGAWFIARPAPEMHWPEASLWRKIGAAFGVLLAYAFLFQPLGFAVATTLLTVALGRLYGGGWRQCVIGGVSMGTSLYFFFDKLLDVAIPVGDLWKTL